MEARRAPPGWGSTAVARRGELVDAIDLDGFVALDGDMPIGLLTYALQDDEVEVVTIQVEREGIGAGHALMDARWHGRRRPARTASG